MFLFAIITAQSKPAGSGLVFRLRRFLARPFHEKSRSIYARWRNIFPAIPFPIRLPFGAWFIGRNDVVGSMLTYEFEPAEWAFVQRFLMPGMVTLDIGAHHGFYSLLAAKCVGPTGSVFSFEPSSRERKALRLNVLINRANNVHIQPFALEEKRGESAMYIAEGKQTGLNSLRPPAGGVVTSRISVQVAALDELLETGVIERPDFIKLDVEGAELSVIRGAKQTLSSKPRPVILAEVEDVRTEPWGYAAIEILRELQSLGYSWFRPVEGGHLVPIGDASNRLVGNFVAIPVEDREAVLARLEGRS